MKLLILLLCLFSFNAYAMLSPAQASKQMDELDSLYKTIDSYCDGKTHHADLIAECKSVEVKNLIKDKYRERLQILIIDKLEKGKL
jgi:hypothetical protein